MSEIQVLTADQVRILVHQACPPSGEPRAAVVIAHGFGASAGDARVAAVTRGLVADGFAVLAYDARGHGRSEGEATLGHAEQHDVEAVAHVAYGLAPRVVCLGASMGAIAVLRHAVCTDSVSGAVIVGCPAEWKLPRNARGLFSTFLTQTPIGRAYARWRLGVRIASRFTRAEPPVDLVARLQVPLAIVHGRADPFIAWKDATVLYDHANEPRRIEIVDGMRHAFDPVSLVVAPLRRAVAWVLDRAAT